MSGDEKFTLLFILTIALVACVLGISMVLCEKERQAGAERITMERIKRGEKL